MPKEHKGQSTQAESLVADYREQAKAFYHSELDKNDWDLDDSPEVSLSDKGAYVQFWRWFPLHD